MEIKSAHSPEQIRRELVYMVYGGEITLERFMRLYLAGSALVYGGRYDDAEAEKVNGIIQDGEDSWLAALDEINAAFRALEMIQTGAAYSAEDDGGFTPEWLASVCSTAAGMANDTFEHVFSEYSLVTVFHLVAASVRRNGGETPRPLDKESVLAALKKVKNYGK